MPSRDELKQKQQRLIQRQQLRLKQEIGAPDFDQIVDRNRGAPASVRAIVGAARSPEDRLANVRRFFPDAIPFGEDNFVFTDPETNRPTLYNPPGGDLGDVASVLPELSEFAGGVIGGVAAAPPAIAAAPATGGASLLAIPAGVGLGAAAGREVFDVNQAATVGRIDTRGPAERVVDAGVTTGVNAIGQRLADVGVEAARGVVRAGGNRLARRSPQELVQDFSRAGVTPRSPGAVSGSRGIQIFEQGIGQTVGGAGTMARAAQQTLDEVEQRVFRLADELSPATTRQQAGTAVKRGAGQFLDTFQERSTSFFDELDQFIPADATFATPNTVANLQDTLGKFPNNPALGELLTNPRLRQFGQALENGQLSYRELKEFRSAVGRMLTTPEIVADIPRAEVKSLYAAITDDMRSIVGQRGNRALKAFDRANNFYRAGLERIEGHLREVLQPDDKVSVERVFSMIQNTAQETGARQSVAKLWALRRSVPKEKWATMSAVMLRRMGAARPSAQDATGEAFSVSTFMTEWNKLSKGAREVLFSGIRDKGWIDSMDSLTRVMSALKEVERQANVSGTARVLQASALLHSLGGGIGGGALTGSAGGDVATGALAGAAAFGGRILAPQVAARLMTKPAFVRWLARAGSISARNPNSLPKHLGRLAIVAEAEPAINTEIAQYVDALRDIDPAILAGDAERADIPESIQTQ